MWVVISGFHALPCDDGINLEGRRRALGDKALFSNLIITLQKKKRGEEKKGRREEKRRGEEKEKVATIGERKPKR